jgi:hypothetical protein
MIDIYQGEPKIFIDENGTYITVLNGQPIMEQGFENDFLIDLIVPSDWFANKFLESIGEPVIGSDFEKKCAQPINLQTFNDIRNEIQKVISRYKKDSIIKDIKIDITNPEKNTLSVSINIVTKTGVMSKIDLVKNGANWKAQIERDFE